MEKTIKKNNRIFTGQVVSISGLKTLLVKIDTMKRHPKYNKSYKQSRKFSVHDENNTAKVGDLVKFVECRPLSKSKRWRSIKE